MNLEKRYYDNLNFVRVFLSLLVTWSHCYPLTGTNEPISGVISSETGGAIAVKAFFFISGLLVAKSWLRSESVIEFALARLLRIFPALFIALIITICLAFISSSTNPSTFIQAAFDYFVINITLFSGVAYELPGAYANQSTTSVNGSLWTLPWEVRAYFILLVLGLLGVLRHKIVANFALAILAIFLFLPASKSFYDNNEVPFMLLSFIAGVFIAINVNSVEIPKISLLFFIFGAICLVFNASDYGVLLLIFSIVLFLGFTNHISLKKLENDPSFGIYVFSFPIQQFLIFILGNINPLLLFFLTVLIVYPLSIVSWIFLEQKALAIRIPLSALLNRNSIRTATSAVLLLAFITAAWPAMKRVVTDTTYGQIEVNTQIDYLWGIYIPSEKSLSLRRSLSTGYADQEIIIKNGDVIPFIGKWDDSRRVKLGAYSKEKCQFTFYNDLSTRQPVKTTALPCTSATSQPLLGDWHKEGILRTGMYLSEYGLVVLENKEGEYKEFYYGEPNSGLSAVAGDWNNDGAYSIAVWNGRERRIDISNKNESTVADYSFKLENLPESSTVTPFSVKLPNGSSTFGLYDQDNGLIHIISLEKKAIMQSIEYGPKLTKSYPIFLNF